MKIILILIPCLFAVSTGQVVDPVQTLYDSAVFFVQALDQSDRILIKISGSYSANLIMQLNTTINSIFNDIGTIYSAFLSTATANSISTIMQALGNLQTDLNTLYTLVNNTVTTADLTSKLSILTSNIMALNASLANVTVTDFSTQLILQTVVQQYWTTFNDILRESGGFVFAAINGLFVNSPCGWKTKFTQTNYNFFSYLSQTLGSLNTPSYLNNYNWFSFDIAGSFRQFISMNNSFPLVNPTDLADQGNINMEFNMMMTILYQNMFNLQTSVASFFYLLTNIQNDVKGGINDMFNLAGLTLESSFDYYSNVSSCFNTALSSIQQALSTLVNDCNSCTNQLVTKLGLLNNEIQNYWTNQFYPRVFKHVQSCAKSQPYYIPGCIPKKLQVHFDCHTAYTARKIIDMSPYMHYDKFLKRCNYVNKVKFDKALVAAINAIPACANY